MNTLWRIELLGGLQARGEEQTFARFATNRTGALLAYLAVFLPRAHSRGALAELLWPDAEAEAGRLSLRVALNSLRHQLEPPGMEAGAVLRANRLTVQLNPDAVITDVGEFEQALREATQAPGDAARGQALERAIALYAGPLLPDEQDAWVLAERERLETLFQNAQAQHTALRSSRAALPASPPRAQPAPGSPVSLPTGTITLLLTSVAVPLAPGNEAAWKAALAGHRALLRREFARLGGHEFHATAAGFAVAFGSAADALACAVACQQSIAAQIWPAGLPPLRLAIALATGELRGELPGTQTLPGEATSSALPEAKSRMETEPLLAQAAQMLAAAHGGQTLCAEATALLLRPVLPHGVHLLSLGAHRLYASRPPEPVFQVVSADSEPGAFPPLRAPRVHPDCLPVTLTRFWGRQEERAHLARLLLAPDARLITLTGPGGIGKTRLAMEAARDVGEAYAGAVWFVPLAELSDPRLLAAALQKALRLSPDAGQELWPQVGAFLNAQATQVLLLLDNFEQLVEGGAESVQTLLEQVAGLTCLITSRHLLNLAGERELRVEPLPLPRPEDTPAQLLRMPCARLFVDRAQSARPDFQITVANAPHVARLCAALEGIPLALELAASRARAMTPLEMLTALEDRFDFLTARKRMSAARQQSLWATVEWSYQLLAPDLQRLFCRLSVFRGGWTADAAADVCEEPAARDHLARLADCSLIHTEEDTDAANPMRFWMLETLRAFGEHKLPKPERAAARDWHLRYFLAFAETAQAHLQDAEQAQWLDRLTADHANLRAALEWSQQETAEPETGWRLGGALWQFFLFRGHLEEGRRSLDALLARGSSDARSHARADALNGAGAMAQTQGDYLAARARYAQSLALYRELEDSKGIANLLNNLGLTAELTGDYPGARAFYDEALKRRQALQDRPGLAASYQNIGIVAQMQGDYDAAQSFYEQSLALKTELGNLQGMAGALNNLGNVAHARRDYALARRRHEESLAIRRNLGELQGIAASLNNLGMAAEGQGDWEQAGGLYAQSLALKRELGDRHGQSMSLLNLGRLRRLEGEYARAHAALREGLRLQGVLGDTRSLAEFLNAFAELAWARQQPRRAAWLYGAYDACCAQLGMRLPDAEREEQNHTLAALRTAIGEPVFAARYAAGRGCAPEKAIAYALKEERAGNEEPIPIHPPFLQDWEKGLEVEGESG